jgi:putative nucleotidyltransferase with HDIG domain
LSLIGKRDVHKRSEIWKYSYNVFIGYAILSIVFAVMHSYPTKALFYNLIISGLNSIMTGIIVIGLFPIYENLFDITTSFKLLEFSDLNSSLMRELMLKAPGTYQHSLMVANLAERAASEINANALLTKIGAYYHDIGKMKHPEYFVENQKDIDDSIHNKVSPKISSTMIISHIKYGIELAKSYGLPDVIINFIPEHHGTSLVKYFYHKALEHSEKVSKEEFMYPGPKPKSKETAIVMLADSIEAASRTLQKTTTQKIKELVTKIITSKINDGQLDECELTMKDIKKLSISFKDTLLGIYHQRIEYPEEKRDGLK